MGRGRQKEFTQFGGTTESGVGFERRRFFGAVPEDLDGAENLDVEPEVLGRTVDELPDGYLDDKDIFRYQHMETYWYPTHEGNSDGTEIAPVQFKTIIYTLGEPTKDQREDAANENGYVRTAFDTGTYDGYMSGFDFVANEGGKEKEVVSVAEARGEPLGVMQFEVEAYNVHGGLSGHATGYVNHYKASRFSPPKSAPQREVWDMGYSSARDDYEVRPASFGTGARERAKNIGDKAVFINGYFVGEMVASRGSVILNREYDDSITDEEGKYRNMADRQLILDETTANPQGLRDGGNLYKVEETDHQIRLVTADKIDDTREYRKNAANPDEVDPEAVGGEESEARIYMRYRNEADDRPIEVHVDERKIRHLGLYEPFVRREVEHQTEWV